jgi:predicted enzyme related to lactoylglutathione lyase
VVEVSTIRAVLFAKDLQRVTNFYCEALGLERSMQDENHALLRQSGFELIVHQIPDHFAATIEVADPPNRRESGSLRLDYPVASVKSSRARAASHGGCIDEDPPSWAERGTNFFLGYDPEGNVFGVSERLA